MKMIKKSFCFLGSVLRNVWVVTFLIVILLSVLFWFFSPMIGEADRHPFSAVGIRLVVISVFLVFWLCIFLIFSWRGRKSKAALEETAEEIARRQILETIQTNRTAIIQNFARQMDVLRAHLPGKRSGKYVYHLPWYLMLGMRASGKSTFLRSSGQEFPLSHLLDTDPLAPVRPTEDFSCWVTNEAVFIDTPGSLIPHEGEDRDANFLQWDTLIKLLTHYRGRRPINGVVLVISVDDVLAKSERERAVDAQNIRRRIWELTDRLGTRFPIYVLLSKVDTIAGFIEFFEGFHRQDREQVWGISFPVQKAQLRPGEREVWRDVFNEEFGKLIERLNQYLLKRVHEERDVQRRALIYGFPQRVGGIQRILETFLVQIFAVDRYTVPPLLRGIYMVSSVQSGIPKDPLMDAVTGSFGIASVPLPSLRLRGAHFTQRILGDIVVPEAGLASDNRRVERQKTIVSSLVYVSCGGLIAGFSWFFWSTYETNRKSLSEVQVNVGVYNHVGTMDRPGLVSTVLGLDSLKETRDNLQAGSSGILSPLALTSAEKLVPLSQQAYGTALNREFLRDLIAQVEKHLRDIKGKAASDALLQGLRVYLMLGNPDHLEPVVVQTYMRDFWLSVYPDIAPLRESLDKHLSEWLAKPRHRVDLDERLVGELRQILSRTPRAERVYSALKSDGLSVLPGGIDIFRAFGPDTDRVFTSRNTSDNISDNGTSSARSLGVIPRLFTAAGWESFVYPSIVMMSEASLEDGWVTGDFGDKVPDEEQFREFQKIIGEYYMRDYISSWRSVVDGLDIVPFENVEHAVDILKRVSGPNSPLLGLLRLVSAETNLPVPSPDAPLEGSVGKLKGSVKLSGKAAKFQKKTGKAVNAIGGMLEKDGEAEGVSSSPGHVDAIPFLASYFAPLEGLIQPEGDSPAYMESVRDALNELYLFTRRIAEAPEPSVAAFDVVRARVVERSDNPMVRLRFLASNAPPPVQGWLMTIAEQTWAEIVSQAWVHLDHLWVEEVYTPWNRTLAGRFPFDPSSDQDALLEDVTAFLASKGRLETFYATNLLPFIDPQSGRPRDIDGARMNISERVLEQIRLARLYRAALFSEGEASPRLTLSLQPVRLDSSIASAILDVDTQKIQYRHGPPVAGNIVWPMPEGTMRAELRMQEVGPYGRILRLSETGPWALFRLLQKAEFRSNEASQTVVFSVSGRSIAFDFWSERHQADVFAFGKLPHLRFPREL